MNADVMAGLGAAFSAYGNNYQDQQRLQREEQSAMRKAQMAADLEMRLTKAKMEYAKANPTYGKFVQGRFGDVLGFDEQGNAKQVYTAPEEERQSYKDEYAAQRAYKEAQAGNAEMKALLAPMLAGAKVGRDEAAAGKDERWVPAPPKAQKDPNELDASGWLQAVTRFLPNDFQEMSPEEKREVWAAAEKTVKAQGYRKAGDPVQPTGIIAPPPPDVDKIDLMNW